MGVTLNRSGHKNLGPEKLGLVWLHTADTVVVGHLFALSEFHLNIRAVKTLEKWRKPAEDKKHIDRVERLSFVLKMYGFICRLQLSTILDNSG